MVDLLTSMSSSTAGFALFASDLVSFDDVAFAVVVLAVAVVGAAAAVAIVLLLLAVVSVPHPCPSFSLFVSLLSAVSTQTP